MKIIEYKNSFAYFSLFIAAIAGIVAACQFLDMHQSQPLYPSESLTKKEVLSKYNENIKLTSSDTDVFYFEGTEPGGKVLILGGTHPNEPAGFLTAYLILKYIFIIHQVKNWPEMKPEISIVHTLVKLTGQLLNA